MKRTGVDDHEIQSGAPDERPRRPQWRRRRRPIRRLARLILVLVTLQAGLWLWLGRGELIERLPEMVSGDMEFLQKIGLDREWLVHDQLPARRFMVHPRIAAALSSRNQSKLEKIIVKHNGEMFVDSESWSNFSDPHLCSRCIAIGYGEKRIYPFVARATTGYTMHPSSAGAWQDGQAWPVMRRDHVYVFVLGVWVRLHEGNAGPRPRDDASETIPV